ncbi:hypothetical protein [Leptospira licerasiae]|uniref:hypothetical protein n=1 Tax=Leptospira licerasiae TaxID=447106 RepID=UPI0010842B84|nr:hypothetical protein [Leptospira licerasiae]TGM91043.1 hypothetical protein EHR05_09760 [Leptospira licerasiae]
MQNVFNYPRGYDSFDDKKKELAANIHDYFRKFGEPGWENKEDRYSSLYLIESDIEKLRTNLKVENWLFPVALCLFSGIDILARIQSGDLRDHGNRERFFNFLRYTQQFDERGIEDLYDFRCSLVHGYTPPENRNGHTLYSISESTVDFILKVPGQLQLSIPNLLTFFKNNKGMLKSRILECFGPLHTDEDNKKLMNNFILFSESTNWIYIRKHT